METAPSIGKQGKKSSRSAWYFEDGNEMSCELLAL